MHEVLENGCEIFRHYPVFVEIGLMQTEIPGKPEAWLFWMEGQSLTSEQDWMWGTRAQAIQRINVWLECIGLALDENQIVER